MWREVEQTGTDNELRTALRLVQWLLKGGGIVPRNSPEWENAGLVSTKLHTPAKHGIPVGAGNGANGYSAMLPPSWSSWLAASGAMWVSSPVHTVAVTPCKSEDGPTGYICMQYLADMSQVPGRVAQVRPQIPTAPSAKVGTGDAGLVAGKTRAGRCMMVARQRRTCRVT